MMDGGMANYAEFEAEGPILPLKVGKKTYKVRKKIFVGWGSEELMKFLISIGRTPDEPISQHEVYEIIMAYIKENNLIHPQRKKKVLCDERLRSLFGRKALNRLKISKLLESHFAENQDSDYDSLFGSEEETDACKRQRKLSLDLNAHGHLLNDIAVQISETLRNSFASVVPKNVKLIYLRRSLIEQFFNSPETFENKLVNSFVRVKSDPNDYSVPRNFFRLVQVTDVGSVSESYNTGGTNTDIVLRVSNMTNYVRISMLSDDDFTEEECEDLRQRVKEGLVRRLTVGEIDQKARSLHEDITNHWIDREILMLQKRIDRANEKGWRKELFEYIETREKLQNPSERLRMLKEIPKVIAEAEMELEASPKSPREAEIVNSGNGPVSPLSLPKASSKGTKGTYWITFNEKAPKNNVNETKVALVDPSFYHKGHEDDPIQVGTKQSKGPSYSPFPLNGVSHSSPGVTASGSPGNGVISLNKPGKTGTAESTSSIFSFFFGNGSASKGEVANTMTKAIQCTSVVSKPQAEINCGRKKHNTEMESQFDVIDLNVCEKVPGGRTEKVKPTIPVIDLDGDNDEDPNCKNGDTVSETAEEAIAMTKNNTPHSESEERHESNPELHKIWYYRDPNGGIQGPFTMHALKVWKQMGYFDENFKVWITGRSPEDAILLNDAMCLTVV